MKIDKVKYFLMFMGYPRSGHTLVASILNAHPNVMCSNQQYIIQNIGNKDFNAIKAQIVEGTPRGKWNPNAYIEPLKQDIMVIGDKTGHRTIEHLISHPEDLDKLKKIIPWKIKWVHVVRNPYDCLATWVNKNVANRPKVPRVTHEMEFNTVIEKYANLNYKIQELKRTEAVITIPHERVIRFIDKSLDALCKVFEIKKDPEWRKRVIQKKWKEPRITRRNIQWTPQMLAKVKKLTKQYNWLKGYDFGARKG